MTRKVAESQPQSDPRPLAGVGLPLPYWGFPVRPYSSASPNTRGALVLRGSVDGRSLVLRYAAAKSGRVRMVPCNFGNPDAEWDAYQSRAIYQWRVKPRDQ